MYILVDITNKQALARHESFMALAALGYIQFANTDTIICSLADNKSMSVLDKAMLINMAAVGGYRVDPAQTYSVVLKIVREWISQTPYLELPFSTDMLVEQAHCLSPDEVAPFVFSPDSEYPLPAKAWPFAPQRNIKRANCSQAIHFASRGRFIGGSSPNAPGAAISEKRSTSPSPVPKRSSAPAAPRAPAAPGARPKSGTSTGQVWDIADKVAADFKGDARTSKAVRKEVIIQCEAAGINKSTASVQFGKWAATQACSN